MYTPPHGKSMARNNASTRTRKSNGKQELRYHDHTRTTPTANYAARGKSQVGRALRRNFCLCPAHCVCVRQVCFAWIILYSLKTAISEMGFLQTSIAVSKWHTPERLSIICHVSTRFTDVFYMAIPFKGRVPAFPKAHRAVHNHKGKSYGGVGGVQLF